MTMKTKIKNAIVYIEFGLLVAMYIFGWVTNIMEWVK